MSYPHPVGIDDRCDFCGLGSQGRRGFALGYGGAVICEKCVMNGDFYKAFAADLFEVEIAAVTADQRDAAKRAAHFAGYSGTVAQLAAWLNLPAERVSAALRRFEERLMQRTAN
jgi:hypothetical protein